MARWNAASLAFDGALNPLSFRTNCSEAARISASVAGGSKLKRVLMLLHISFRLSAYTHGKQIGKGGAEAVSPKWGPTAGRRTPFDHALALIVIMRLR